MFTYTVNPAETEVTIDPNLVLGKGPVRFQFKDEHGNFTGFTEPAITIESNLSMTDNDIYNLGGEEVVVTQGPTPTINNHPNDVLLGSEAVVGADIACDWYVESGVGVILPNKNVQSAVYYPINPQLSMDAKIDEVGAQFGSSSSKNVTIRCTEPNNPNNHNPTDTYFSVTWAPIAKSLNTNYEYSWFAENFVTWSQAAQECAVLTEGAVSMGTWGLPSYATYDGLNLTPGKTSAVETSLWCGNFNTGQCDRMSDKMNSIWLEETANVSEAHMLSGGFPQDLSKYDKNTPKDWLAVRCVK